MDILALRDYCLSLKGSNESTPFGPDTLVFKVYDKMYCACDISNFVSFNLKALPEDVIDRRERYISVHPGYHMSKKHWITVESDHPEISDELRKSWIKESYELVKAGLPKKKRQQLDEE